MQKYELLNNKSNDRFENVNMFWSMRSMAPNMLIKQNTAPVLTNGNKAYDFNKNL